MGSRRWNNVTKIVVIATLVVMVITLAITFRVMITPTVVAFLLAFILGYPVNWIQRSTGWARSASVAVIYVVLLVAIILTPVLVLPRLVELVSSLRITLEELITNLQNVTGGPFLAIGPYQLSLSTLFQQAGDALSNILVLATTNPMSIARGVTNSVITIVYVLVLNFWILKDLNRLQRLILEWIPTDYQEDARRLGQELGQIWHAFLRGQLALAFVVGILTWLLLAIVGMPNAGGLAVLAGFMEFLPAIGPGLSGTIGTIIALYQGPTWLPIGHVTFAIIVLIVYSIIAQIESIYLIPRLVGSRVQLHPAVTFVGIISGTIVFGLLGVLLATPIIASARTIFAYIYRKLLDLEPFEPLDSPQSGVRIPGLIAGRKIDVIVFDLDGTITPIDWRATEWSSDHLHWLDRVVNSEQRSAITRRLMIALEGWINLLVSQLNRLDLQQDLQRLTPVLNLLRGYPEPAQLKPFPGVIDMLHVLRHHYQLVLVTTRKLEDVNCLMVNANLDSDLFNLILTRESVRNQLPNSEALMMAATKLNVEPSQVLVVSDSDGKLRSARAAQMATAGVLCGLGSEGDLDDADVLLTTTPELTEWL